MPEPLRSHEESLVIVLQHEVPVRLVNISRSGCLLQVARSIAVGTVGRLRIAIDDTEYADDVRVARVTARGTGCELGVELLWVPMVNEPRSDRRSLAWRT